MAMGPWQKVQSIFQALMAPGLLDFLFFFWFVVQMELVVKDLTANVGDTRDRGSIPGSGRCPGERNDNLLQYSCLENSMDRGV